MDVAVDELHSVWLGKKNVDVGGRVAFCMARKEECGCGWTSLNYVWLRKESVVVGGPVAFCMAR